MGMLQVWYRCLRLLEQCWQLYLGSGSERSLSELGSTTLAEESMWLPMHQMFLHCLTWQHASLLYRSAHT